MLVFYLNLKDECFFICNSNLHTHSGLVIQKEQKIRKTKNK